MEITGIVFIVRSAPQPCVAILLAEGDEVFGTKYLFAILVGAENVRDPADPV